MKRRFTADCTNPAQLLQSYFRQTHDAKKSGLNQTMDAENDRETPCTLHL
jgi:hypothetical protein